MLVQVLPSVFTISGLMIGRVYLIQDDDGYTLIDAGSILAPGRILKSLQQAGLAATDIRRIVITHAHPDHAGDLPALKAATGAEVFAPKMEVDVIEGRRPVESGRFNNPGRPTSRTVKMYLRPCRVDHALIEGAVIPAFGGLQALSTPGHTTGHMTYWQSARKVMFCGDVVIRFPHLRPPFSAFTSDAAQNRESMRRITDLAPESLLQGHGEPIRSGAGQALKSLLARR